MIYCQKAEQLWEREEVELGAELGARDGCYISTSSSVMVRIRWVPAGSLTPSTSAKQSWHQHVLCMVVFGGITKRKRVCCEQLPWGLNILFLLCHLPLQGVLLPQQVNLSGSGNKTRGDVFPKSSVHCKEAWPVSAGRAVMSVHECGKRCCQSKAGCC